MIPQAGAAKRQPLPGPRLVAVDHPRAAQPPEPGLHGPRARRRRAVSLTGLDRRQQLEEWRGERFGVWKG
jgi:hypothetical protein